MANWKLRRIGDCFDVRISGVDKVIAKDEIPVRLCNYVDVYHNRLIKSSLSFSLGSVTEAERERFTLNRNDVVITKDSETPDDIAVPAFVPQNMPEVVCGYHLALLRPDPEIVDGQFFAYALQTAENRHYFFTLANGVTRFGLTQGSILNAQLLMPCLAEQKAIAKTLSSWDCAIELTEELIVAKQKLKHSFMQRTLTGPTAPQTILNSVLRRYCDPVDVELTTAYRQIGIRSHGKGIFHKERVTGKSLGNKRVYYVKPGCFTFNVVFAWEQAVARTTSDETGMIASHRFPMYEPFEDRVDVDYLLYFFKTKRGKHLLGLASPGGAGRNRTLSQDAFMKLKIPLPKIEEQRRVAKLLSTADLEIEVLEKFREFYSKQKKGLMQQLLTGKTRVKLPKGAA